MALSEILISRADKDAGGFDENEAGDLALHVRQCARRYRTLDRKLDIAIRLILVLILLYVANMPGGWSALSLLRGP